MKVLLLTVLLAMLYFAAIGLGVLPKSSFLVPALLAKCSRSTLFFTVVFLFFLYLTLSNPSSTPIALALGDLDLNLDVFNDTETFINFNYDASPFSAVFVPLYNPDSRVIKVYDGWFYDNVNSNVIQVTGRSGTGGTGSTDMSNDNIQKITIYPRNPANTITQYTNLGSSPTATMESQKTSIDTAYSAYAATSPNGDTQFNFISWGADTYLYVLSLDTASKSFSHAVAGQFRGSLAVSSINFTDPTVVSGSQSITYTDRSAYSYNTDINDDQLIIEPWYSNTIKVYQVIKGVEFDYNNGNLLIVNYNADTRQVSSIDVHYREGTKAGNTTRSDVSITKGLDTGVTNSTAATRQMITSAASPYFVLTSNRQHTIMVYPSGKATLLVVFENGILADGKINIKKTLRFNSNLGIDTGTSSTPSDNTGTGSTGTTGTTGTTTTTTNSDVLDAFVKWYTYWQGQGPSTGLYTDDYLLKTQIVPPVMPASTTVIMQGSGSGSGSGSGTGVGDVRGPFSATASVAKDAAGVITHTGDNAVDLAKTAGGTVASGAMLTGLIAADGTQAVYGDTKSAVGSLYGDAKSTVGVFKDAGSALYGDAKSAVGSVKDTVTDAAAKIGGGAASLFNPRQGYDQSYRGPTSAAVNSGSAGQYGFQPSQSYLPKSGTYNQNVMDPYSVNGNRSAKETAGNYVPMTADFSRFGK